MPPVESAVTLVRRQLERVLENQGFARNERMSRFLRFIVERHLDGRDDELKESVIAVEIFGRRPDHDPKRDPIVRTEAGRLRARLGEYYSGDGKGDPLVIELPKGGYVPVFREAGKAPEIAAPQRNSPFGLQPWLMIAVAAIAVAAAITGWWRMQQKGAPIAIAVLPLDNLSHDPASDYFADGLTDELIRNLSIIDGLAPRSRTSSFTFKGKPRNVREVGRQLEVDYVLEGSVLRAGQQLRINVQLVRASDDFPVWSGRYDRELADVVAIQDDISRGIVNSLRLKLGRGRRRYETSADAYDLYLRARAMQAQLGLRGIKRSVEPLEQATVKDPAFAPAYAGLALAYAARSGDDQPDLSNDLPKMRAAGEKAIHLDPLLAEAHAALGVAWARDAEWDRSEKSFHRALELDPNNSSSYNLFAMNLLMPLGRIEEAVRHVRTAEKKDPLSPYVQGQLSYVLFSAGRFDEAAVHCQKSLWPRQCLAGVLLRRGRIDEAVRMVEAAFRENEAYASDLGYAYARAGRREDAERLAALAGPMGQARVFVGLGDNGRVFEALERAIASGPVRIGRDLNRPEFAPLRGDPRLQALRKRVGLPEVSVSPLHQRL
jgi:serine/threonine-protein kinase